AVHQRRRDAARDRRELRDELWTAELSAASRGAPATDGTHVYLGVGDGGARWRFDGSFQYAREAVTARERAGARPRRRLRRPYRTRRPRGDGARGPSGVRGACHRSTNSPPGIASAAPFRPIASDAARAAVSRARSTGRPRSTDPRKKPAKVSPAPVVSTTSLR